jgi:hypothetical protein
MKDFINRLKSPVVIAQIVSIIASLVVAIYPEFGDTAEKIVYSLTIIINLVAGVNNPTDKEHF